MAFKMKYKNLEEVVDQLRNAVKAHGKQADIVEEHIEKMEEGSPAKKKDSPMFDLNLREPKVNIAGGQLRPKVRKNYIGLTFTKEFKKR